MCMFSKPTSSQPAKPVERPYSPTTDGTSRDHMGSKMWVSRQHVLHESSCVLHGAV